MSNLSIPKWRAQDVNGDIVPDATASFFLAGTSTPKAVYSDADLDDSLGVTLTADSDGWFPRFYADAVAHKVKLFDEDGGLVWEEDDISPSELAGGSTGARVAQIASSPLDHGAAGDGTTNDYVALQAAITAASGTVDLLGKTYRCDSTLGIPSGLTLRNGVLDFSQTASNLNSMISIAGSQAGGVALTSNGDSGDTTYVLSSVSGLAAGDWMVLSSADVWTSSPALTNREMSQINSISVLTVTPKTKLVADYLTFSTAVAAKITPKQNIVLEDLRIKCNPSAGGLGRAVFISCATDIDVRNVRVSGGIEAFVTETAANVRFEGCRSDGGAAGFRIDSSSRDVVLRSCKHFGTSYGFYVGAGAIVIDVRFVSCTSNGAGFYIDAGSTDVHLEDCRTRKAVGYGISMLALYGSIRGGSIEGATSGGIHFSGTHTYTSVDALPSGIVVDGVKIVGGAIGVYLERVETYRAVVANCQIRGVTNYGIATGSSMASSSSVAHHLHNNVINCESGAYGIWGITPMECTGNVVNTEDQIGVYLGDWSTWTGGRIEATSSTAGHYPLTTKPGADQVRVVGARISRTSNAGPAVFFDACTDPLIADCHIYRGTYAVQFSSCTGGRYSGCTFSDQATGQVTGAALCDQLLTATVAITATEIVGNAAGDIGHAAGVTLVTAHPGKIIEPVQVIINFTYATAAYTAGGDISAKYSGGANATGVCIAGNSIGASASNIHVLRPLAGQSLVNTNLVLVAASAFTNPGTAAGTATIKTIYRLIDA
jgi:hypothetical protein